MEFKITGRRSNLLIIKPTMMHIVTDSEKYNTRTAQSNQKEVLENSDCRNCGKCHNVNENSCDKKVIVMETKRNFGEITVIPLLLPCIRGC